MWRRGGPGWASARAGRQRALLLHRRLLPPPAAVSQRRHDVVHTLPLDQQRHRVVTAGWGPEDEEVVTKARRQAARLGRHPLLLQQLDDLGEVVPLAAALPHVHQQEQPAVSGGGRV
jgi:hypothetical protein